MGPNNMVAGTQASSPLGALQTTLDMTHKLLAEVEGRLGPILAPNTPSAGLASPKDPPVNQLREVARMADNNRDYLESILRRIEI